MKGTIKLKLELNAKHKKLDESIADVQKLKIKLKTLLATEATRIAIQYEPMDKGEWDLIKKSRNQLMPKSLTKGKDITWGEMWQRTLNEASCGLKNLSSAQTTCLLFTLKHIYGEGKAAEEKLKQSKAGASKQLVAIMANLPEVKDPNARDNSARSTASPIIDAEVVRALESGDSGSPIWDEANAADESGVQHPGE